MKTKDQQLLEEAYKQIKESTASKGTNSMHRGITIPRKEAEEKYRAFMTSKWDAPALYRLIAEKGLLKKGAMIAERENHSHLVYLLIPKELLPEDYSSINAFSYKLLFGTKIHHVSYIQLYPQDPPNPEYNLVELFDSYKQMTNELPELEGIF